ncbi:hypothetical protein PLICRDRAFT_259512 [Plicaturopsis crispa FD-325 SS-3]|nr:hypothetical protein PLICRDRAFT_259512 [Plicaturopsis crispa FD-325 SS-3]
MCQQDQQFLACIFVAILCSTFFVWPTTTLPDLPGSQTDPSRHRSSKCILLREFSAFVSTFASSEQAAESPIRLNRDIQGTECNAEHTVCFPDVWLHRFVVYLETRVLSREARMRVGICPCTQIVAHRRHAVPPSNRIRLSSTSPKIHHSTCNALLSMLLSTYRHGAVRTHRYVA